MLSSDEEENDCIFSAHLDSVGTMANLLKAIAFSEKVNLFITENGLRFVVEEGKYVQAYILIQKALFLEYQLAQDEVAVKIPLKELLECLKVFCIDGGKTIDATVDNLVHTSIKLVYRRIGSPFEFVLEEKAMVTEFKLKTEEIDNLMELEIDPVKCKIAMKSDLFFDLLAEVDSNSPEMIEIHVIPRNQEMIISGNGVSGLMEVIIPASSAVVEYFEGAEECKARHRLSILKYAFKAIQLGDKLVLKMNEEGVLSLSFLLCTKTESFVEFFCIPLEGDEEEDG